MGSFDFPSNLNQPDNAQVFIHPAPPIVGRPKCFNCTLSSTSPLVQGALFSVWLRSTFFASPWRFGFWGPRQYFSFGKSAPALFQTNSRQLDPSTDKQQCPKPRIWKRVYAAHYCELGVELCYYFPSVIAHLPSLQHLTLSVYGKIIVLSATF